MTFKVGDLVTVHNIFGMVRIRNGAVDKYAGVYPPDMSGVGYRVIAINFPTSAHPDSEKSVSNDIMLVRAENPTEIIMVDSKQCLLVESPVFIGKDKVEFNKDGSIQIGYTTVDKATLDTIIKRLKR